MMEGKYVLGSVGVLGIVVISAVAIHQGYDGGVITGSIAAISAIIAGVVGYLQGKKATE